MTGVATFAQTDYTVDTATVYKGKIDANMATLIRLAVMFAPHEQASPDMTVHLDAGHIFNGTSLTEVAAQSSATITAPLSNPRIDRIVIDRLTGVVSVVAGTPAVSPAPPAIPSGKAPVAQVALTNATTSITNSIITDERDMNTLGTGSTIPAYGVTTNTGNAYVVTTSPAFTSYNGQLFYAKINATNTGVATINANAVGVKSIVDNRGNPLTAGALLGGSIYALFYDGTNVVALNLAAPVTVLPFAADTGAVNAYAVAPSPAISAYANGQTIILIPGVTNTGASTLQVSGLAATSIKLPDGTNLPAGALKATGANILTYQGTYFVLQNYTPSTSNYFALQASYQAVEGTTPLTPTSSAWDAAPFNTTDLNTIPGASRSGNTITLPAGTYETSGFIDTWNASGFSGVGWSFRIQDITNNVALGGGLPPQEGALDASNQVPLDATFTLAGTANIQFQYFCVFFSGAPRFGYPNVTGTGNVDALVKAIIKKVG